MASVYLGNWQLFLEKEFGKYEPPTADLELTFDEKVGLWPVPDSVSTEAPEQGDLILFTSGKTIYACGRIGGISAKEPTIDYLLGMMSPESPTESISAVATIIQYQEVESDYRGNRPTLTDLFDSDEIDEDFETEYLSGDEWVLQKLPDSLWEDNRSPSVLLSKINGVDASGFHSDPPNGRDPKGYQSEGFDEEGGNGAVDRTGTLLEQQYLSRDNIRDASKATLQITILLFGVIVAGISLFREELEEGLVDIQTPAIAGGILIGIGAIIAAVVFVHTAARPRPYADLVTDEQSTLNDVLPNIPSERREREVAEFSKVYHNAVEQVGIRNRILSSLVGAAVGVSLGGIFLSVFGIIYQFGLDRPLTSGIIFIISVLTFGLTTYAFLAARGGFQELDRDWESEEKSF